MAVAVTTGTALKSLLGGKNQTEVEAKSVGEILDRLGIRDRICDAGGNVRRHFNIHVNEGEEIRLLQGLDTALEDGDSVTILSAIAGGAKVARKVWLTFPRDMIERPVLWEVGRKFDVVTNIRQASIGSHVALVGLELCGEATVVEEAIAFMSGLGISVEPIELNVVE